MTPGSQDTHAPDLHAHEAPGACCAPPPEDLLSDAGFRRALWVSLALNAGMFVIETGAGLGAGLGAGAGVGRGLGLGLGLGLGRGGAGLGAGSTSKSTRVRPSASSTSMRRTACTFVCGVVPGGAASSKTSPGLWRVWVPFR